METKSAKVWSLIVVVLSIILCLLAYRRSIILDKYKATVTLGTNTALITATTSPERINFDHKIPTDFSKVIPLEKTSALSQSYSLGYANKKQSTVVFTSKKSITENYSIYEDFLKKDGWQIINTYSTTTVMSLYGKKNMNEINITIMKSRGTGVSSDVSVSYTLTQ